MSADDFKGPGGVVPARVPKTKTARAEILIESVVTRAPDIPGTPSPSPDAVPTNRLRRIAGLIRHLALQRDLQGLGHIAETTTVDLIEADRCRCLFHSGEDGAMWTESKKGEPESEYTSDQGIAGAAARSGIAREIPIAAADPSYSREIDDPQGTGQERILAQPVATPSGEVHAVLIIVREPHKPPFLPADRLTMEMWAEHAAPLFHMHYLEAVAEEQALVQMDQEQGLFRREAFEAYTNRGFVEGDPLRTAPAWTRLAHWIVLLYVLAGLGYMTFAKVGETAPGQAIIASSGQVEVPAKQSGVLSRVAVKAGDSVRAGQVLAELNADEQRAAYEQAARDVRNKEESLIHEPENNEIQKQLAELDAELERARETLAQRQITSPVSGRVGDVRATISQAVEPGQVVVTLVTGTSLPKVQAFVPGRYRPELQVGQTLTLDLDGYAHVSQHVRVTAVGEDVLGPEEMQRVVGEKLRVADAGPLVLVEAILPTNTFEADGDTYTFHDGMTGRADVELDEERIIFALFPRLKELFPQ